MRELFQGKLKLVKIFKKYFIEIRKKKYEREKNLINKIEKKIRFLNEKHKNEIEKYKKEKIEKEIEKLNDVKNGKREIININRYITRFAMIVLFCMSFLNISLNLKGYNYFIYMSVVIIILLLLSTGFITIFIKKKVFSAYYYNFKVSKIIFLLFASFGIGYFLNNYRNELEQLNKKSILVKNIELNSIEELKNSNIEIINKDSKIKWKIDKNLKILTYEETQRGKINIDNTIIEDNNKVTLSFFNEKNELTWLKGKIIYFNWDVVKLRLKNKKVLVGEVYGKIIKLDNGETLILNNNFELRDEDKEISDFGIIGGKLKINEIINNILFIILIIGVLIEYEYYKYSNEDKEKIISQILFNEKNKKILKKSVFSILRTIKLLMIPIALIQTYVMRTFIFNLLFDKNLKKGYDTISMLFTYLSKSYIIIVIVLLLPIFIEIYRILKMIENYINENGDDDFSNLKKKSNYLREIKYNKRRKRRYWN